jgi:hypothetical protein
MVADRISWTLMVAAGLAVVAVTAAVWGAANARDLGASRAALLDKTVELAAASSQVTTAEAKASTLGRQLAQLTQQVSLDGACIEAMQANQAELMRISNLIKANFDRIAPLSVYDYANTAALRDYYNAYSAAFDGRRSTANRWIKKGNAQIEKAREQLKPINATSYGLDFATRDLRGSIDAAGTKCALASP